MKLTQISYRVNNLEFTIEEYPNDSYSVDVCLIEDGELKPFMHYRTDEIASEDIIKGLEYFKDYNFIQ